MRCKTLLAAAVLAAAPLAHAADGDRWNGRDKKMHAGVSFVVGFAAANQWPDEPGKAFMVALLPGLLKEVSDANGGTGFSSKDMAANAIGAALGVVTGRWIVLRQRDTTVIAYRTEF